MRVLITGGNGQLAKAFKKLFELKGVNFKALSREQLDISRLELVIAAVKDYRPDVILNCAAYNLVDQVEEDFPRAFAANALGPHNLALAAKDTGAFLIHFSTDYVFDGEKGALYVEGDRPSPINKYGLSKWLGELAISEVSENYLIFRVSWLFGEGKQNFLVKVLNWAEKNEILRIAYDEFSVPTYTETAAEVSWLAYERGLKGLYHLTSRGYCSRLEWAKFFLEAIGIARKIIPVSASFFNLPAKRPFFSVLDSSKLEKALDIELPYWMEVVSSFARKIKGDNV